MRLASVVGVCVTATRLHAERAAVCDFCVTPAALTAQSHRVGEGRGNPWSTARQLDGFIHPVPEVTGVLDTWCHRADVHTLLKIEQTVYSDFILQNRNPFATV